MPTLQLCLFYNLTEAIFFYMLDLVKNEAQAIINLLFGFTVTHFFQMIYFLFNMSSLIEF